MPLSNGFVSYGQKVLEHWSLDVGVVAFDADGEGNVIVVEGKNGLVLGLAPSLPVRRFSGEGGGYRSAATMKR